MAEQKCNMEVCEELFVKLTVYWRSALIGFIALLSLGGGVCCWTWAEIGSDQSRQDSQIRELEAAFNDIAFIRSQANEILDNQHMIIKYLERKKP
jgi:hypothetical protein